MPAHADAYITLEEAAALLRVPEEWLLRILDDFGLTPALRDVIRRPLRLREADLRALQKALRQETPRRGAA